MTETVWGAERGGFICDGTICSTDGRVSDGDPTNDEYVCKIGRSLYSGKGVDQGRNNVVKADRTRRLGPLMSIWMHRRIIVTSTTTCSAVWDLRCLDCIVVRPQ